MTPHKHSHLQSVAASWSGSMNKHYRGDISVSSYRYYNFSHQIIWCSVWICIARFPPIIFRAKNNFLQSLDVRVVEYQRSAAIVMKWLLHKIWNQLVSEFLFDKFFWVKVVIILDIPKISWLERESRVGFSLVGPIMTFYESKCSYYGRKSSV